MNNSRPSPVEPKRERFVEITTPVEGSFAINVQKVKVREDGSLEPYQFWRGNKFIEVRGGVEYLIAEMEHACWIPVPMNNAALADYSALWNEINPNACTPLPPEKGNE